MKKSLRVVFFFAGLWASVATLCNAQGPIASTYNNMTARFNAYFYAKQRILEVEQALFDSYEWNYNKVLPIYPQYDTLFSASQKTQLEDCIKKASISIQYHEGSKWEYDCYVLVGKARLYGSEFPEAVETFKYVNTKSDNRGERHAALVELMRTFVEAGEYRNAESAADYLAKEKLNGETLKKMYLNKAYLYQKRKDLNKTVENLTLAEALMINGRERGRINFIIGQIYQELGFDAAAYRYYKNTLKNSPDYELSFYTKLNMAQVSELKKNTDKKKIRKYFKKLLKDPKNKEYQDKIYYEMGGFELKQGNMEDAISHYKTSVQTSVSNQRQKAYSYLKLSEIYYDSLKNYELAKLYYDSTAQTLPRDEENYQAIKERQEILEEFVKYIKTIRVNDSLLALAKLSTEQQQEFIAEVIEERIRQAADDEKRRKKEARRERQRSLNTNELTGSTISTSTEGVWYFYNNSSVSKGRSEFIKTWGQRPLEDNWRRSNKTALPNESTIPEEVTNQNISESQDESNEIDVDKESQTLLASIPTNPEDQILLLAEVEEAYYQVGSIYNFQLKEEQNAINAFETLITRFDTTHYKPEVLYQLFLLYKGLDTTQAVNKANILLQEFPETVYAKLIFNPRYREETLAKNQKVQEIYAIAYGLYREGDYLGSISMVDSTLDVYNESDYHDNLQLLKIINIGKTENIYQYQFELGNFIENHPDSELGDHATKLLTASREHQINLFSSSRGKYVRSFNQNHYFLLVYESSEEMTSALPKEVEDFIATSNLNLITGNLVLDEKYSIVLVNDLPGKGSANTFLKTFSEKKDLKETFKGQNIYQLVITKDNFEILYESKDLRGYLNFYDKYYP